jgi:hypothetical protein
MRVKDSVSVKDSKEGHKEILLVVDAVSNERGRQQGNHFWRPGSGVGIGGQEALRGRS